MNESNEHAFSVNVAKSVGVEKAIILREIRRIGYQNAAFGKDCQYGKGWVKCPSILLHSKFPYLNQKSISRWITELNEVGLIGCFQFQKQDKDRTSWILVNNVAYKLLEAGKKVEDLKHNIVLFRNKVSEAINQHSEESALSLVSFEPKISIHTSRGGIYVIDNVYVGKAQNIRARINQHMQQAMRGSHCNNGLSAHLYEKIESNTCISVKWIQIDPTQQNEFIVIKKMIDSGFELFNNDYRTIKYANKLNQPA